MKIHFIFIFIFTGLMIGNFLFCVIDNNITLSNAIERSFFQFVALVSAFIALLFNNKVTHEL